MPNSLSLKSLIRLQKRQFSQKKGNLELVGPLILLVYFWAMEIMLYFLFKEQLQSLPPIIVPVVLVSVLISDFLLKIIMVRDHSVMDPFLKSRPVSRKQWNRFLALSQFWNFGNLVVPVIMLPLCLLFVPFPRGLAVWVALYLFSVFGGFLVMLLKRRGRYVPEKVVSKSSFRSAKLGRAGYAVFSLQSKSFLRSKRIRTSVLILTALSLFEVILTASEKTKIDEIWVFFFITYAAISLPQYGFGIEAGCFAGLWTRPISVKQLLVNKFWLSALLCGLAFLIIVPIFLLYGKPILLPIAYALFTSGFGCPLLLIDAYKATPFDLFGKAFFNYQGTAGMYRTSSLLGSILIMVLGICLPWRVPGWPSFLILSGLGLTGFLFHRPYFSWVERKFMKNKYKYLEAYQSK